VDSAEINLNAPQSLFDDNTGSLHRLTPAVSTPRSCGHGFRNYVQSLTQGGERPFMALLNAPGNLGDGHWVVVQGMNGAGKISVLDPAGLSYEMSVSGFRNAWMSGALVF
jgi:ABC-type bacteriocin/lantibiotic exporter with double-glycine peptidase domain